MKKTIMMAMLLGGMLVACTEKKQNTDNDMKQVLELKQTIVSYLLELKKS